jgi:hypothetical protein
MLYPLTSDASMIPLQFPDKTAALTGAFLNRFAIGFVIGAARLPVPGWAGGLIFGVLLSLPDAIITRAYAPILIPGAVGGSVCEEWRESRSSPQRHRAHRGCTESVKPPCYLSVLCVSVVKSNRRHTHFQAELLPARRNHLREATGAGKLQRLLPESVRTSGNR